jgi:hypothetical protein
MDKLVLVMVSAPMPSNSTSEAIGHVADSHPVAATAARAADRQLGGSIARLVHASLGRVRCRAEPSSVPTSFCIFKQESLLNAHLETMASGDLAVVADAPQLQPVMGDDEFLSIAKIHRAVTALFCRQTKSASR